MAFTLNQLLDRFSKTKLAFVAIFLGLIGILIFNPLYDSCEAQKEVLKDSQKKFLYLSLGVPEPEGGRKKSQWEILMEYCRTTNSSGGCFELFSKSKVFISDLRKLSSKCALKVKTELEVKGLLWKLTELMIYLAWGEKAPESDYEKRSWLDNEDMHLFCLFRRQLQFFFPEEWRKFKRDILLKLPESKSLKRKDILKRTILSYRCET